MTDGATVPAIRRRRWPRIVALVALLAIVGGGSYWLVRPTTTSATALFKIRIEAPSLELEGSSRPNWQRRFDTLKRTQLALLKSRFVRTAAVRMPGVSSLSIIAGVKDPEAWLLDHLEIDFPEDGEILAISLSGPESQAQDLSHVVDAVAEAYRIEVLAQEQSRQLAIRDMLVNRL